MTLFLIIAALALASGVGAASFRYGMQYERRKLSEEGYVRLLFGQREDVVAALEEMKVEGFLPPANSGGSTAIEPLLPAPAPPRLAATRTFKSLGALYAHMESHDLSLDDVLPHLSRLTRKMTLDSALTDMANHCRNTRFHVEPNTVERLFVEFVAARKNPHDDRRITSFMYDTRGRSDGEFRTALLALDRIPELSHEAIVTIQRFCRYGLKSFADSDGCDDGEWQGPARHEKCVRDTARTIIARRKIND